MSESVPARVTVERVGGRVRMTHLSGGTYLRAQPLGVRGDTARVALLGTWALLLAGDDLRMEVTVGPGVWLELVEPSGTVAYDADGGSASWRADLSVADGACLVWRGAPFVVTAGADITRDMRVRLSGSGRALVHETLALGRSYESSGGPLRSVTRVDVDGRPLLVEDLDLRDPSLSAAPGVMGGNRVQSSTFLLGARPERAVGVRETLLHGPGALARAVAGHAHEADAQVADSWRRWRAEFTDPAGYEAAEPEHDFA
ncbi:MULTISPECIES: urease accessory protein UreD [unclassified Nocardiopsis]|uniref:urease accessory protein UreD n=1 Tax=unclassified Nocardiopsis TaxID=2649073 RepID=UPI00340E8F8A